MQMLCFVVTKEENEERMMIDPASREDAKVKELLQVYVFMFSYCCIPHWYMCLITMAVSKPHYVF